ncbi:hypothetical protein K8O92_24115 [Nocardia asteroides]|nr:hypothetical protein K8O92_24115 [Nocardia asteroides]
MTCEYKLASWTPNFLASADGARRRRIPQRPRSPAAGTVEPIDDTTCLLHTGADTPEALAHNIGQLGMHGIDFTVGGPPELVELLRTLGNRYLRAVTAATRDPTVEGAHSPSGASGSRSGR